MTTPSGQTVTYTYADHQITGITVNSTSFLTTSSYEPFGPVRGLGLGNGSTEGTPAQHRRQSKPGERDRIGGLHLRYAERITGIANSTITTLSWSDGYDTWIGSRRGAERDTLGWSYDAEGIGCNSWEPRRPACCGLVVQRQWARS